MKRYLLLLIPLIIASIFWFIPLQGLTPAGHHLLCIFVTTIVVIILGPFPMGAISFMAMVVALLTGTLNSDQVFSGFTDVTVWLVFAAFLFSQGFVKTGLGERLAYQVIAVAGKNPLTMSYSFLFADLLLAPAIPSNTARTGGILYPILRSISLSFDSLPHHASSKRLGQFLMMSAYQGNLITSAMFLTAMAANPLAARFLAEYGIQLDWMTWMKMAIFPGCLLMILVPWIIYKLMPPQVKDTSEARLLAQKKLAQMGPLAWKEIFLVGIFILMLILWIFGEALHVPTTLTALIGIVLLLLLDVLDWQDIIHNSAAWDTFMWFAVLVMLSTQMMKLGVVEWMTRGLSSSLHGMQGDGVFYALILFYFFVHYFFASCTTHVSAMLAGFLALGKLFGLSLIRLGFSLCLLSNLMGCLTHFGSTPASIYYGSGYVLMKDWWRVGFILGILYLLVVVFLAPWWWRILGFVF